MAKRFFGSKISILLAGIIIGISGAFSAHQILVSVYPNVSISHSQLRAGFQGFTNPLIACGTSDDQPSDSLKNLKDKLSNFINSSINDKKAKRASIYFRYMDPGFWTGVNENDLYNPASLAKLPVMIAYYRAAEYQPSIMDSRLLFNSPIDNNDREFFKSNNSLVFGNYYVVKNLITRMIVNSGNNSYDLLLGHIDKVFLAKVYDDINISILTDKVENLVSARSFSTVFRALYNATYLNKKSADQALQLLSKVDFKDGLNVGLPSDITVAHKFGERSFQNPDGSIASRQLHDCGIVYYPGKPYLICVMTEGGDFTQLESVISGLSKISYDYVSQD